MIRKSALATIVLLVGIISLPAEGGPRATTELTIQDTDGDNLLEYAPGEDYLVLDPSELAAGSFYPPRHGSILNFLQLSDFHVVDEDSPGRVEFLDPTQRPPFTLSAR